MMRSALPLVAVVFLCLCCASRSPDAGSTGADPPPAGDECGSHGDCEPGMTCRGGVCLPYEGGAGDPCYDELDCELGMECVSGTCEEP